MPEAAGASDAEGDVVRNRQIRSDHDAGRVLLTGAAVRPVEPLST
jgi:hypothetical protein